MEDYTFQICLSLDDSPHSIRPDLEESELTLIGLVAVQWAHLEHAILASTFQIAEDNGSPPPADAESLAAKKRIRAWRLTIEQFVSDPEEKSRLLRLARTAADLEQDRNKLMHGLWSWDHRDPTRLTAHSPRSRVAFRKRFDISKLDALAHAIGAVSFALHFPGGKQEAMANFLGIVAERESYVSRSTRLAARTKAPSHHRPHPPKPPKA